MVALRSVIDRYLGNKRMIETLATAYGVVPVFVWQPVPTHKFSSPHYPFQDRQLGRHAWSRRGYALMEELRGKVDLGPSFLWLADLHQGFTQPMYIDQVHYSPPFTKEIARAISAFLIERKIVPAPDPK